MTMNPEVTLVGDAGVTGVIFIAKSIWQSDKQQAPIFKPLHPSRDSKGLESDHVIWVNYSHSEI